MSYAKQIALLLFWILAVILIFKFIETKQIAAVVAGCGFLLIPGWLLFREIRSHGSRCHMAVLGIFLLCSALPIFLLRILNWGQEFSSLNLFGVEAQTLHKASNFLYMSMVVSAAYQWWAHRNKKTAGSKPAV